MCAETTDYCLVNKVYSAIIQNWLVPIYDLVRMTSRFKCGRILDKTQYLPREEINRLQMKSLHALITHAYRTVPYYHRVFKETGLRPEDIRTVKDLKKLPVLNKVVIRENFKDLISKDFPKNQLVPYRTGGTGSPLKFYITRDQMSWQVAAEYRAYSWAGYRLGDRCLMFWGSPIDLGTHRRQYVHIAKKVAHLLERTVLVDPWVLSDRVLSMFAHMFKEFDPKIVRGYAGPLYIVARYLLENDIGDVRPKAVITSAETLFDPMRKTVERAFGCPVFDYYGSREVGAIAAECEEHCGYHITAENVLLEFVSEGEHVSCGENGAILVTGLRNYGMPLIRYDIGDIGKHSNEICSCGRGLPLMESIEGRASQFLGVRDKHSGRIVPLDASVIMDYIMIHLKSPLESFKIIQESLDYVVIKIVRGKYYLKEDTDFLLEQLHNYLGTDVNIDVQFVDALPPLPSGKRSPFISKINAFEHGT